VKPRWVIGRKELAGVFTERTILLAVVIQVFVAGFSSFLVLGLSALVDPNALPNTAKPTLVYNATTPLEGGDAYGLLLGDLHDAGIILIGAPNDTEAQRTFYAHGADGILLIRPLPNASEPARLQLVLPDGDLKSTLTLTQVKDVLERYEGQLRDQRHERLDFQPLVVDTHAKGGSFAFVYSLLVPLLVFLPVILSGALCADSLTEEVQRGTLPMLLVSPATPADVIEGKLLANVAVTPLLAGAWFLLLALNDLPVPIVGGALILVLATAMSFLLGLLACGIALATRDRNKAHVLYATAMFLLLGLSLALPTSPVNAVALLAAGSASAGAYALVAGTVVLALGTWLGLRLFLKRTASWMAAGGA
jgi:hypothetical protein